MSKKDKIYLNAEEIKFNEILDLLLSDYLLAIKIFNKWKTKILKRFSGYNSDLINTQINNYIVEKELIFNDFLNNIPEYYNYANE